MNQLTTLSILDMISFVDFDIWIQCAVFLDIWIWIVNLIF